MSVQLKKVQDQVIVITGASSGIGLSTARMAAKKGAKLVLVARNESALQQLTQEINSGGTGAEAIYVVADVGKQDEVKQVAMKATERFGGWDTWVNNAGTGIFGRVQDGTDEDHRRLFDTNFWGVVYGSLEAVKHLKHAGGALINVGSAVSDRTVFLQGMYSTSKHAVKGFTDSIRMEMEAENAPISVTLIQPAAIDTPFPQHARNYMDKEPSLPPPVYSPHVVAEAILHTAETPTRSLFVGSAAKTFSDAEKFMPGLTDKMMETETFQNMNKTEEAPKQPQGALHAPTFGLQERGEYPGMVKETSLYTQSKMHPVLTTTAAVGAAGLIFAVLAGGKLLSQSRVISSANDTTGNGRVSSVNDQAVADGVIVDEVVVVD